MVYEFTGCLFVLFKVRLFRVEKELLAQVFSHVDPPGPEQRLAVQLYSPISSASLDSDSSEDMRSTYVHMHVIDTATVLFLRFCRSPFHSSTSKWSNRATFC